MATKWKHTLVDVLAGMPICTFCLLPTHEKDWVYDGCCKWCFAARGNEDASRIAREVSQRD